MAATAQPQAIEPHAIEPQAVQAQAVERAAAHGTTPVLSPGSGGSENSLVTVLRSSTK